MQALWMLLGAAFFATMGVCVKFAAAHFNSFELVFYRGLVGSVFIGLLARQRRVSLRTNYPGMHLWRSAVGVSSLCAWFYAIAVLPLPTAMTLNYMSGVWIAAFLVGSSWFALRGRPRTQETQWPLATAVLAGFLGVVLMLQPTIAQNQILAGLVGLVSGILAAFAYLKVTALGRIGEPETRTVFYFAVGTALAGLVGMAVVGVSAWSWAYAVWLLPVGLFASLGQLCMTRAYSRGTTLVVANLQYSGIVFSVLYSMMLFDEAIPWVGWLGMALIIASGMTSTLLRARAASHSSSP